MSHVLICCPSPLIVVSDPQNELDVMSGESLKLPPTSDGSHTLAPRATTPPPTLTSVAHSPNALSPLTTASVSEKRATAEESRHCQKKRKKRKTGDDDVVWISDINEDVVSGRVAYDIDRCLPATVNVNPITKTTAKVWNFFRSLEKPISEIVPPTKRVLGMNAHVSKTRTYVHLCVLCLKDVKMLGEDAHRESWAKALCRITNTSNAENHLKSRHRRTPEVMTFLSEKEANSQSSGALDSGGKM